MSKRKLKELFARTVCAHAGSVIATAMCLAGLAPFFLLGAAFVPEGWFLEGLTTVVLVAGLLLFWRLPGHGLQLDSMRSVVLLIASGFRRSLLSVLAPERVASLRL
jgi:hypothetical protein